MRETNKMTWITGLGVFDGKDEPGHRAGHCAGLRVTIY